jgi:hypothetical protein
MGHPGQKSEHRDENFLEKLQRYSEIPDRPITGTALSDAVCRVLDNPLDFTDLYNPY